MTLIRTQINLEEEQYRLLQFEARQQKRSLSALIRKMLSKHITQKKKSQNGLLSLALLDKNKNKKRAKYSIAEHHDDYLYGKYSKKWGSLWKNT